MLMDFLSGSLKAHEELSLEMKANKMVEIFFFLILLIKHESGNSFYLRRDMKYHLNSV